MISRAVSLLFAAGILGAGVACEDREEVKRDIADLERAKQESPEVVQRLENDLQEAKLRVVELEKKLALARQGITDEVREERADLTESLERREAKIQREIEEAQAEAAEHNALSREARQRLEGIPPVEDVEAEIDTRTRVVPGNRQIQQETTENRIELDRTRVHTTDEPERREQAERDER